MKAAHLIILAALFLGSPALASQNPVEHHVSVVSIKREIFHFKVDKQFLGATVEVYDETGAKVLVDAVSKRKMIVDFIDMKPGNYTIKITKSGISELFECAYGIR